MSKKDRYKSKETAPPKTDKVKNSTDNITNGLGDALGYTNIGQQGWGNNQSGAGSSQLSQIDTLQANNRWYFVSNMRQLLSESYVEHGLIQTICNVPVDDALRGGVDIHSKQLSLEQVEELQTCMDRQGDLTVVGQAFKYNRLFGGAGIMILTEQDHETQLNLDAIGSDSELEFRAVDLWELFWTEQNTQQYNEELQIVEGEFFNYYAKKVHKSRVMTIKGLTAPSFLRPRLRGWGFSVVESLIRSINQYLKANDLCFEVLDEFKLDIYKIKDLTNTLLSPNGDAAVRRRIDMANYQKNYQNAISMDSEDDYLQKQLSFAGLAEVQAGIRMQVASDMRMPLTKLFGISSAGFNSGEDDIENYNSMVEGEIRQKMRYDILRVIEIRCQKLFGFIPDDLTIDFKPLRILSAEQEENIKNSKFNRLLQAKQVGLINDEEFRSGCNKGHLFDISLDNGGLMDISSKEVSDKKDEVEYEGVEGDGSMKNESTAYLVAAYAADRGEEKEVFENPGKVDEALWKKAKEATMEAFGEKNWKFTTWLYKKWGGTFGTKM